MVRLGAVGRFRNGMFGSVSGGLARHGGYGGVRRGAVKYGELWYGAAVKAVLVSYGLIRKVWYREVWYGQSRRFW